MMQLPRTPSFRLDGRHALRVRQGGETGEEVGDDRGFGGEVQALLVAVQPLAQPHAATSSG